PATAKDVVAVGGAYNPDTGGGLNQNDLAPQSSRGPTTDGRIKPTIVTIFDGDSAMSDGNPSSGTGLPDAHWAGTSYSTPAAAADAFRTQVVDGTAGLLTGDDAASTFHVGTPGPAKFVLTWNDYPGTIGATKALVNDLDLEVTAPDGTVYRGNHFAPFAQGQS